MPKRSNNPGPRGDQRWSTFLNNHASAIVACDFCVVVTANFRVLYAFVLIEHGSRRLIHSNVTANPTAEWARQQLREAIPSDHQYRFLLHDRDCIFSTTFDKTITNPGIKPIKTPRQSPKANAICERVIDTLRRECLDSVIPLSESHLRRILTLWITHYNDSRPHSSIGPDRPSRVAKPSTNGVRLPRNIKPNNRIIAIPILGGLHHDYQFAAAQHWFEYLRTTPPDETVSCRSKTDPRCCGPTFGNDPGRVVFIVPTEPAAPLKHHMRDAAQSDCRPVVPSRYAVFKAYLTVP